MKKYACQYAIVRFLPYLETGEFANVGVVLMCPEIGYFNFRLLTHIRRITAFFEELDVGIYRRARDDFKNEFKRIQQYLAKEQITDQRSQELARHLFAELTRPREAMMRFDGMRVVLADDPAQQFDELFAHYVERNFATKAYQERLLEDSVRKVLEGANLNKKYKPETLGDTATYHTKLPFVHREGERAVKAIKPLHLAHEDPAQIYDHGWAWLGRVGKLRALRLLPEQVLFPVQGPAETDGERFEIYQEITEKISAEGVLVVPVAQNEKIIQFATIH